MICATKRKSLPPAGLSALRLLLVLVVALCLGQTRVWGFGITGQHASEKIAPVSASAVGENTIAWQYDASDSPVAAKGALDDSARYAQYWQDLSKQTGTLSDRTSRAWYLSQEAQIPALLNKAQPLQQQAMQAFTLRNSYRTYARELMADREYAAYLNKVEPNMTWQQIVDKYSGQYSGDSLWNRIIEGSQSSRSSVNTSLGF